MRKILFISLLSVLVLGCKSRKLSPDTSGKFVIENLGRISSAEDLERIYPEASIEEGSDMFEEGTVRRPYTILFPDTTNEALLTWNDDQRTRLHQIRVSKDGRWETSQGIEIGTTYEELEEINGPFSFYGFGWDYSGAVDWKDGKLADTDIRVFLSPGNNPPGKFYGDQIIEATEEEIEAMNLRVQAILYQAED